MKKKLAIIISLFAALMVLFAVSAFAVEVDGIYYRLSGSGDSAVAAVTNENATLCTLENVVIPETVTYEGVTYTVTTIDAHAFSGSQSNWGHNQTIKSLFIPKTVTSIGAHMLRSCKSIESVTIKAKNEAGIVLSDAEFYDCQSLKTVDVADSDITSFKQYTFYQCYALQNFELPPRLTYIGNQTFRHCSSLTSMNMLDIPVETISSWAFNGCSKLSDLKFSTTLKSVGNNCFQSTPLVTKLICPDVFNTISNDGVAQIPLYMVILPTLAEDHGIHSGAFHECSPKVVIYEGTNYEVLTGEGKVFAGYTVKPFSEFDPNTTYTKNTLFYGSTTCQYCNGLLGEQSEMFNGEKYVTNYVNAAPCTNCSKNSVASVICGPLFVNLGYSKAEYDDTAFTYGISLNKENIAIYEAKTGEILSYGFIIGLAGTEEVAGNIVSANGESLISSSIITNFTEVIFSNLNVYQIKMTRIETEAQKTLPIYCNMYITNSESVSYVGSVDKNGKPVAITLKALPITK